MKLGKLLEHYEKLERLVGKLPKPLQQPILNEISPLKDLFLRQRAPRVVLLGDRKASRRSLVDALFGAAVVHEEPGLRWTEYENAGQGRMRVLDARRPGAPEIFSSELADESADIFLFLQTPDANEAAFKEDLEHAVKVVGNSAAGVLGILITPDVGGSAEARQRLNAALHSQAKLADRLVKTLSVTTDVRFRLDGTIDAKRDHRAQVDRLAHVMTQEVPVEAKLELSRLSGVADVQREIAQIVVRSTTAICGAIGTQPIPLADFPILTSLQGMMVASVVYISGRPLNMKLAAEFMATLGANFGLGLVCREGARALAKFLPGWGNAVSGAVAGAATYAIGRSAIAFYIDGVSIEIARRIFQRKKASELARLEDKDAEE